MQNQNEIIIITAAGGKTWLKERFMPSSWVRMFGEGLIGDYAKKMDTLRDVDDRIHEWTKDLGALTKEMRQALRGSRFIDVAILLGRLNKKLKNVHEAGKEVKKIEEGALRDFERKHDLNIPDDILGTESESGLTTEAGFLSDLKRKWIAKKFETAQKQKRTIALNSLVDRAERLAKSVRSHVNNLETARASGDIGRYVDHLKQISLEQKEFQSMFVPIYNLYLKPVVDEAIRERKDLELEKEEFLKKNKSEEEARLAELGLNVPAEEKPTEEKAVSEDEMGPVIRVKPPVGLGERIAPVELEAPEVGVESETLSEVLPVEHRPSAFSVHGPSEHKPEAFQGIPTKITPELALPPVSIEEKKKRTSRKKAPPTTPAVPTTADMEMNKIITKHNHAKFIMELVKASEQEDPYLLAAMLSKYAEQIEDEDLQKSLELLAISEGILDV